MQKLSAGVLLHRCSAVGVEVLLVHPGGPFWSRRDQGSWQIPKGLVEPGEDEKDAARREAAEELGVSIDAPLVPLGRIRQSGGKLVVAFAAGMDVDVSAVRSNLVDIEWPPRSGRRMEVPEVDEARWFAVDDARGAMLPSQLPLLDLLVASMDAPVKDRESPG